MMNDNRKAPTPANFEIPDRSALRTVRNDNNQTEDTP
jgi:hypothetical protein